MELKDIQQEWNEQYTKPSQTEMLIQLFNESKQLKVKNSFRKIIIYTSLYLVFNSLIVVSAWNELITHFFTLGIALPMGILIVLSTLALIMSIHQLEKISRINFSRPILFLQKEIARLKISRVRHNRFIFIFSNLYFWLMIGLVFSWNIETVIRIVWENAPFVVLFHLGAAILWFPFALWMLKKYDSTAGSSGFWSKLEKDSLLTDQSVNRTIIEAESHLKEIQKFEKEHQE